MIAIDTELPEELKIFLLEAYENVDSVEQQLVDLEQNPANVGLLNAIFRSIHTIKGNSGFYSFKRLETLCHRGESLLDSLRSGRLPVTETITSELLRFVDAVRESLEGIEQQRGAEKVTDYCELIENLTRLNEAPGR